MSWELIYDILLNSSSPNWSTTAGLPRPKHPPYLTLGAITALIREAAKKHAIILELI